MVQKKEQEVLMPQLGTALSLGFLKPCELYHLSRQLEDKGFISSNISGFQVFKEV